MVALASTHRLQLSPPAEHAPRRRWHRQLAWPAGKRLGRRHGPARPVQHRLVHLHLPRAWCERRLSDSFTRLRAPPSPRNRTSASGGPRRRPPLAFQPCVEASHRRQAKSPAPGLRHRCPAARCDGRRRSLCPTSSQRQQRGTAWSGVLFVRGRCTSADELVEDDSGPTTAALEEDDAAGHRVQHHPTTQRLRQGRGPHGRFSRGDVKFFGGFDHHIMS